MDDTLIQAAKAAAKNAYAPYSGFRVGAALVTPDGRIFSGCNVENASYGATICAERAAIAQAVSAGYRQFTAVAIYTDTDRPTQPCGICRQTLLEFGPQMRVISSDKTGARSEYTLDELLPHNFSGDDLKQP